jgi:hypothetical protein
MSFNITPLSKSIASIHVYHTGNPPPFEIPDKISTGSTLLLDIFPINNGPLSPSDLSTTLKKYLNLIMLAQEALDKFEKRVMLFFDPLVGENACQIRAAMFAEMINKDGIDEHICSTQKELADHADKIKDLITNLNIKRLKPEPFKSYLQQNHAILEISEEISVIFSSFILSETRIIEYRPNDFGVPGRHESIPYKNFGQKKGFTPKFAFAIIKIAQVKLSEISVFYIQRLAFQLPLSKEERNASMLVFGNFVKSDERHRKLTPFFQTMRVNLRGMQKNNIPIILKIKQFLKGQSKPYGILSLVFGNQGTDDYKFLSYYAKGFKKGVVFIHTKSITESLQSSKVLEEKVLKHKITDLILSAAADHPTYGCDDKHRPDDPLCERYRSLSHEWGTSRSNPSLFMVEHICCDLVEIDSKGSIVETIYISLKQKVEELYDTISDIGDFIRPRLRLITEGKNVATAKFKNKELVDLTMADTNLKNNATIYAVEYKYTPHHRIYPNKKFKLKIFD